MPIILAILLVVVIGFGLVSYLARDIFGSFNDSLSRSDTKKPLTSGRTEPNWKPLEGKIGRHWAEFLYMGRSGHIHIYKNSFTKRYLYLDDQGRCYARGEHDYELTDFDREWGEIADQLGIEWKKEPIQPGFWKQVESLLKHKAVHLGMRLLALSIILKWTLEMLSPTGKAFTQFDGWLAAALLVLPCYFMLEVKWMKEAQFSEKILARDAIFLVVSIVVPFLISILVIFAMFVGNWIPVLKEFFTSPNK